MRPWGLLLIAALGVPTFVHAADEANDRVGKDLFEKSIRPALVQHCYECHSADKKVKGGLLLDSRDGWKTGGDSGPAIEPGKLDDSLLIEAIRYTGDLKMPPRGKLPERVIRDFERWVELGAPDPRDGTPAKPKENAVFQSGLSHWSYQPIRDVPVPAVAGEWPLGVIDRFVLARLEQAKLRPGVEADRITLLRRVYFDLIGLPPTPGQIDAFVQDTSPDAYEKLVDRLLAAPQFGERWGRHWLDVVRYAESVTLRGLVFPEAWRYRDYVIETFNADRPYNEFLREQVAGDLLAADSLEDRKRKLVAVTFLTMGNTNLEEQDKEQLRMDVVDEQLDVIGKGFLAQTITCARCHDHKFDPIPTRDYYALAGILRNTQTLEHDNVSKWLQMPLPLPADEEAVFAQADAAIAALKAKIKTASETNPPIIAVNSLSGVVVDDSQARKVGEWMDSKYSGKYIGDGYIHDIDKGKGEKTLTFLPELPRAGKYEVRFAYTPGGSRSPAVPVTIFSADGEKTVRVNEREAPPILGRFVSLGQYKFELNGQGFVIVSNEGTQGHVTADAVQFIPLEGDVTESATDSKPTAQPSDDLKRLEAELKQLTASSPGRPQTMSVREEKELGDCRIHVRGSVHNLGDVAPRGFLQAVARGPAPEFSATESGRRELGDWLANPDNPLPARVMVNRAWHWLFGAGLVRTADNFGTTGESPSHPELLDHLARSFVHEGWSVKRLVRSIVLSRTYRLSARGSAEAIAADPENRLLSHANRRRLDAECIRDAMLVVSGQLDPAIGGPTIRKGTNADYGYQHTDHRRSVYAPVFRNSLPELFEVFDFADPSMPAGVRNVSTVAPQALFLMNHPFVRDQSKLAAERLIKAMPQSDEGRVERAYRSTLGRLPTATEKKLALDYVRALASQPGGEVDAFRRLCHALFASVDFRFID